jgi:hypothetical protein
MCENLWLQIEKKQLSTFVCTSKILRLLGGNSFDRSKEHI